MSTIVIGGGIAGLVAAEALVRAGEPVTLLDGGRRGGSLAARRLDGLDPDVGAEGFATRGGAVPELLGRLGLADRVVAPAPTGTWVHGPGGSSRIPDGAVLGIPTSLTDPAIDQLGATAAARVRRDAELAPGVGADAVSLGALVRARMGDELTDTWPGPLVAGVHRLSIDAIDPELLLPGLRGRLAREGTLAGALAGAGGALAGLRGGMVQLVDGLSRRLTDAGAVLRPVRAEVLEPVAEGSVVGTSDGATLAARRVLLACPPWDWPSGLPVGVARQGELWPAPREVDVVTLVLADDGGGRRAGVVVAADPGADAGARLDPGARPVRARALTYSSAKWTWLGEAAGARAVVRLTYDAVGPAPGAGTTDAATTDAAAVEAAVADAAAVEAAVADAAVADAAALTGATWTSADLRASDRTRWRMPRTAVEPGMTPHREAMREALAAEPGLDATGGWLAGTGLAWAVADGTAAAARMLI